MSAQQNPSVDARTGIDDFEYEEIDDERAARIDETLALTVRFFDLLVSDPSIADDIPAYASVIFLPHDDADLAARNRAAGERMRAAGRIVHFFEV